MQFLKYVLATVVGIFLTWVIGFLLLMGVAASASKGEDQPIEENSVLKLSFNKPIREREGAENPFEGLDIPGASDDASIGIVEFKKAIAAAKTDDKIKGIYMDMSVVMGGFASLEELRNALIDFKKSGKFIVAYGEIYTEGAYYLASVADKIYLNPAGMLEFNGLNTTVMFFKGAMEKLEIKPEIFKVGDFKSAVEPFLLEKMSDPSRQQTTSFLNSIYGHYLDKVAASRGIDRKQLGVISDSMLVREAPDALKYKLVTNVGYYDEVQDEIRKLVKIKADEKIEYVGLGSYQKKGSAKENLNESKGKGDRVAVIFASGEIQSGKGSDEVIGSDRIAEAIRKARLDKKVKAVVLRINSPGGSAMASDVMWREVMLTKKVKPVIASMSDVAASGGYYMAMACDTIVAQPTTITGSIGVFGMMFNAQDFLKNKLGITTDGVKTGQFSDLGNMSRPLTAYERKVIQQSVEKIYYEFTSKAAEGRDMKVEDLRAVASGRVWSGVEAKERGLVDVLGGLDDAVRIAAAAAKLKEGEYKIKQLPAKESFFDKFMSDMEDDANAKVLETEFGTYAPYVQQLKSLDKLKGVQTRLPFDILFQ
jgi:protease-4